MDFYCHPRCSTCKKARNWLEEHDVAYTNISLLETTPSKETWLKILNETDRTLKSFFNTSGNVYRENNLKDAIPNMSKEEAAEWLASNGMVVKRPFAIKGDTYTSGFKAEVYENTWLKENEDVS